MSAIAAGQHSAALRLGISDDEYQAHRAAGESHCWRCKKWLFGGRFYQLASGEVNRKPGCKRCWHAYMTAYTQRRREQRQTRASA